MLQQSNQNILRARDTIRLVLCLFSEFEWSFGRNKIVQL